MAETSSSVSSKSGLPPGTLIHVGEVLATETRVSVVDYTRERCKEHVAHSIEDITQYRNTDSVTWVNVEGLINVELIDAIGQQFDIHPLVLEDILNTHQRPKFEQYDDYLFLVFKVVYSAEDGVSVNYEQASVLILNDYVFTFKEKQDDIFEPIKARLRNQKGRFRSMGADYLAYTILDTVVDLYLSLQDYLDKVIESVEDDLLATPDTTTLANIQRIRRELIFLRRSSAPLRDLLNGILRSDSELISDSTLIYFRDVHDHVMRVTDAFETYRDMMTGLMDIYNSTISNRMNEIMKVLTVFASIFIPLTFLTGIYGMNFDYMPELKWHWAYPVIWVGFILITLLLLVYFKRKKWL
ncbi:MAG: magnesium/cobalt transporter CorA [Gammaproteobacteria bacterium]